MSIYSLSAYLNYTYYIILFWLKHNVKACAIMLECVETVRLKPMGVKFYKSFLMKPIIRVITNKVITNNDWITLKCCYNIILSALR